MFSEMLFTLLNSSSIPSRLLIINISSTYLNHSFGGHKRFAIALVSRECMNKFATIGETAPTYLIHPHGCVGQLMRSPLIKFINHSASFAIFIFLLLIASTDTLTKTDLQRRSEIRGPDPNVIEMLILWWVIDFLMLGLYLTTVALRVVAVILRKTNQYGTEPLPRNQWPETDPTLLSEALFSIAHIFSFARIIFLFQYLNLDAQLRDRQAGFRKDRSCTDRITTLRIIVEQSIQWKSSLYITFIDYEKAFDSVDKKTLMKLIRQYGVPKIVNIIRNSYDGLNCKIVHGGQLTDSFEINEHLGPLQISLGNMLIDITKFIFIFLLVISSFACGLHQLYYYYLSNEEDNRPRAFSSNTASALLITASTFPSNPPCSSMMLSRLVSSYRTLFWHLFGSSQSGNFEVTFVNKTSGERERMESARNTMVVGEILLLIYHAMAIIVLVNMLIAMMSNSFQTIQVGTCIEYKMFLKE
ncbi:unnamed protein product [Schistosoma mattheei]|uniref:Ion transport domain-containing protein n=1 Tax=Schistosoma mattheei TaxID=31246 RepID=A0A183NXC4_9TREM|nr:unnamed protein product [Schistosoma mattheei]